MIDRTPKPCHHPKARHQHGTHRAFIADDCRCWDCTYAHNEWDRDRRAEAERNGPGLVDVGPVRQHIRALMADGATLMEIASAAGVTIASLSGILHHAERTTMRSALARKVTAVTSIDQRAPDEVAADKVVPAVGSRRRVQALMTRGWSQGAIAERVGCAVRTIWQLVTADQPGIVARHHLAICRVYDELWDQEPSAENRWQRAGIVKVKLDARRKGYAPPLAWDDDTIDDSDATPDYGAPEPTAAERDATMRALYEQGMNDAQIGEAIGRSRDTVRHWRNRRGLPAIDVTAVALGEERDDRLALWQQGLTDREIADRIGRHPDVVRRWRSRHGLESRTERKRKEAA